MTKIQDVTVFASRFRARILREMMQGTGIANTSVSSLLFGEFENSINFSRGPRYSELSNTTTVHDRDGIPQGHTFQERYLYSIEDVVLDSHSGMVFTSNGQIISESSAWPKSDIMLNSIPKPIGVGRKSLHFEENSVLNLPSNGFYHWLVEDLPPFIYSLEQTSRSLVMIFENAPIYVKSLVSRISAQIIEVPRFVRLERYTFTSKGPDTGWAHPVDMATLRSYFSKHLRNTDWGKKVYVSRVKTSRSPDFERELIELLQRQNWTILETEGMSLVDQVEEISSASALCGVHGAGLAGMVWMAPGSQVIELGPSRFVPCFSHMSSILNLDYVRIPYEGPSRLTASEIAEQINGGLKNS